MPTPSAPPVPLPIGRTDPAHAVAMHAATAPLRETFGDRVQLAVESFERLGRFVFLNGRLQASDAGPIYKGTKFEQAAEAGHKSNKYIALLRHSAQNYGDNDPKYWTLIDHHIGPTDVAWAGWAAKHDAPEELFPF